MYSLVLLNVDQHSENVKTRMTELEFRRNNRGINNKADLPEAFLSQIYYDIRQNEIKIPEEQILSGGTISLGSWRAFTKYSYRSQGFEDMVQPDNNNVDLQRDVVVIDTEVFVTIWSSLMTGLSVLFESSTEPDVWERTLAGFSLCAQVSSYYRLYDIFDNLVVSVKSVGTDGIDFPVQIFGIGRWNQRIDFCTSSHRIWNESQSSKSTADSL